MKYLVFIFSLFILNACNSSESKSDDPLSKNSQTEQPSNSSKNTKKATNKNKVKLKKSYRDMIADNIIIRKQAIILQQIDNDFGSQRKKLIQTKKWKGKKNLANRRKLNRQRAKRMNIELGEAAVQKITEYRKSKNK